MLAALKALVEVGYSNMIYPDHVPESLVTKVRGSGGRTPSVISKH